MNIRRGGTPKRNKHRPIQDRKGRQEGMRRQTKRNRHHERGTDVLSEMKQRRLREKSIKAYRIGPGKKYKVAAKTGKEDSLRYK